MKYFKIIVPVFALMFFTSVEAQSSSHRTNPTIEQNKCDNSGNNLGGSDGKPRWECKNGVYSQPRGGCPMYKNDQNKMIKSVWGKSRSLGHGACNWVR